MSTIKVFSPAGEAAGEITVADDLMILDKGAQAVKDTITALMNGARSGSASTLTKGEVAGSGKKPWKQKGTGRARVGTTRNPVWRGGGVAFGPKPRDYSQKVNKKVAQLAFFRALSEKLSNGSTMVIEKFDFAAPKTKLMAQMLGKLGIERTCLIVLGEDEMDEKVFLAASNLSQVDVCFAPEVDVYLLLRYRTMLATRKGMDALVARLPKKAEVTA